MKTNTLTDRDAARISQAASFLTSLFLGRGAFDKIETSSLAEAIEAKMTMMAGHPNCSRLPMIYALANDGTSVFVPDFVTPETLKEIVMKTYSTRFAAKRAALSSGLKEGDFDIVEKDGRFTYSAKAFQTLTTAPAGNDDDIPAFVKADAEKRRAVSIDDPALAEHPIAKANAASWPSGPKRRGAKAAKPAPAQTDKPLGKRAAILAAAQGGVIPDAPDFSAETHARFRKKLDEIVALVKAGDIKGLKAFEINPISSSRKAMDNYRNIAVIALEAQRKTKKAA